MTVRRPRLMDLSIFGIHVNNPELRCCRCKELMHDRTDGIFADALCGSCGIVSVRGSRLSRRETIFYRPTSVYAMHPSTCLDDMRAIGARGLSPQQYVTYMNCVVKIDGELYVGQFRSMGFVALCDKQGAVVRDLGLRISQKHLAKIYAAQQRPA